MSRYQEIVGRPATDAWLQIMQPVRLKEYKQADLHEREQRVGELVADYACARHRLFDKAYGNCHSDGKTRDSLLKGAFKRGLLDKVKRRLPHSPESYQDVLLQDRQIEAEDRASLGKSEISCGKLSRPPRDRKLIEGHAPTRRLEARRNKKRRDRDDKNFKIRCFRCMAKADHYASDCPVSDEDLTQVRTVNLAKMRKEQEKSRDNPV